VGARARDARRRVAAGGAGAGKQAAYLGTVFYGAFTSTRLLAAPLSWVLPSTTILWLCFAGLLAGSVMLIVAQRCLDAGLFWAATAVLGVFCGPLWPAVQAVPVEKYGIAIGAKHYAFVLTAAKIGIAIEQVAFSQLLSSARTAPLAVWLVSQTAALMMRRARHPPATAPQ
jgi:hypothetical protein